MEKRLKPLARLSIEECLKGAMDAGAYPHEPSPGAAGVGGEADDVAAADGPRVRRCGRTAEGGCPHMLCRRGGWDAWHAGGALKRSAVGAERTRTIAHSSPSGGTMVYLTSNSREETPRTGERPQ